MSGRKIEDHAFWAGPGSKGSVFPSGAHTKQERSAVGAGSEMDYEDTTEKVHRQQEMNVSKAKSQQQKPLHRN